MSRGSPPSIVGWGRPDASSALADGTTVKVFRPGVTRAGLGRRALLLIAACGMFTAPAAAQDKSGVRPNVIAIPSGPGTISGLGEQFEPSLNSGSATYRVPLLAPPGTAGLTPQLSLGYDSGAGNGALGIGWTLEPGSIQRQTDQGVPRYGAADRFLYNGQKLVPVGGDFYRLENEGAFLRFRYAAGRWECSSPDGTLFRFGVSAEARVEGPLGTFRWALDQVVDVWGNRILFGYVKHAGQSYLARVDYNARAGTAENEVHLEYEARADVVSDFRAGFQVTTAQRLKRVRFLSSGGSVRRYELGYLETSVLSRLATVTLYGADDITALPTLSLGYTGFAPEAQSVQSMGDAPSFDLFSPDVTLADLDGDSLPDLLNVQTGAHAVAYNQDGRWVTAQSLIDSPSVRLSTNGVELADLDGDGRVDLVAKLAPGAGDFVYFPNLGQGGWEPSVAFTNNPPFSFEDASVRLIDFDGDGLVDVMQTTSSQYYYWRNRGDGSWGAAFSGAAIADETILFSDSQVKLADLNGDRLVDLVRLRAGSLRYWPNLGYGNWGEPVEVTGAPWLGADQERAQLADLDGDGLTDLFLASGTQLSVWLQRGDGTLAPARVIADLPAANPLDTVVRAADLNGSGTADVVWNSPSSSMPWRYLDLSGGVRPGLLRTIDNGLGRTITLDYTSSGALYQAAKAEGAPWGTRLPIALQVVERVTTADARGWESIRSFVYRDGHYDGRRRQFRGFGRTVQTDVGDEHDATAVVAHDFDLGLVDEAFKGLTLATEVRTLEGAVLRRDTHGYGLHVYADGTDGRRIAGADRLWHQTEHSEGTEQPVTTREEFTYDDYGNVLVHSAFGIVEGDNTLVGADERVTTTEYANSQDSWLLGRPIRVLVSDAAGIRLSEARTYYDGEPFVGLALGELGAAGAATRTEAWVTGEEYVQQRRVQRDVFGLEVAILNARGGREEVDYDATHRFAVAERTLLEDGRKLELTASYDPVLGTMISYRDAAGRERRFRYTPLLQLSAILKPGDPEDRPTLAYRYVYGNPLSQVVALSRVEVGEEEVLERRFYYDGLARPLGVVEVAEGGRTVATGLKRFGPNGRVVREYDPIFSTSLELPEPPERHTAYGYDALGRRTHVLLPNGARSQTRYLPLAIERWDAEDLNPGSPHHETPTLTVYSGLGEVELQERLGTELVVTKFNRDALGRVSSVTDALGRQTRYSHDGLGRVVESNHPDAGRTLFRFDESGNLLERTDARGATVQASYDAADRPLEERLFDASGVEEERVLYHYDVPSPRFPEDAYPAGRLTWVEDGAGEEHYLEDDRGRLMKTSRQVDGKSYEVEHQYDALDRMVRIRYPSGRELPMVYGPRGMVESIPGVLALASYDERALPVRLDLANGVVREFGRDAMDRVTSLSVRSGSGVLQSLGFGYDLAGNLLSVQDAVRPSGPLSASRNYVHDDLYRLTSASSPDATWSFSYDVTGNLLQKDDVGTYLYGDGNRATRAGQREYGYNAAGQLTSSPDADYRYDAKGRMVESVRKDGTRARYRYDYTGMRMVKESEGPRGGTRAVYLDRLSEERDGQLIDYVYADDLRIARLGGQKPGAAIQGVVAAVTPLLQGVGLLFMLVAAAFAGPRVLRTHASRMLGVGVACAFAGMACGGCPAPPLDGSAIFYHSDVLGGVALQTDSEGKPVGERAYSPYGGQLVGSDEPYGFTGKELDAESGLHHFGARAYDAFTGRFLSPDPAVLANPEMALGDSQLLSPYAYARNAPHSYTDPDGRTPVTGAAGAGVGAVVGGVAYGIKATITGKFSWRGLGASILGGAVTGGLAGLTMGASLVVTAGVGTKVVLTVGIGAGSGMAGGIASRGVETGSLSLTLEPKAIAIDAVLGGVAGPVASKVVGAVASKAAPVIKSAFAKAKTGIGNGAATGTQSTLEVARSGGRHAGQLTQFLKQTPDQLRKTIGSFEKQIAKHEAWIRDPTSKVPHFGTLRPEHQQNLLHHWGQDIARHQELLSMAQELLKGL